MRLPTGRQGSTDIYIRITDNADLRIPYPLIRIIRNIR